MGEIFNRSVPQALQRFDKFPEIKPSKEMSLLQWLSDGHDVVHTWAVNTVSQIPKWVLYPGLTIGVGLVATTAYFYKRPGDFVLWHRSVSTWSAGYKVKCIAGEKYNYSYMERGSPTAAQPSVLFINGFAGNKEDWIPMVKLLPQNMHVICVDLPSQGTTTILTDAEDTTLYKLMDCFHEFVKLLKLDEQPFHLIGLSMGGVISAIYAARHPKHVDRLTLICPAIQSPIETTTWQVLETNFFSSDPAALRTVIKQCVYNKSLMPDSLWPYQAIIDLQRSKVEFNKLLAKNIKTEVKSKEFEQVLSTVSVPVQIIWGEEDEIVHVSGASLLEELIDSVKRTDILPKCGHVVYMDQSDVSKSLILDFYNTTYSS